jgi:uncharacterized protein YwgA
METTDVILAVIAREGGSFTGNTLLQKKIYFLNELIDLGIEFSPHYYGPYSRNVAFAIDTLLELRFLERIEECFPSIKSPWGEVKRYTYKITSEGYEVLESAKKDKQYQELTEYLNIINSSPVAKDYEKLSRAGKVFCIVKRKGKVTLQRIVDEARGLGWKLSQQEIKEVESFLVDTGFVNVN